MPHSRLTAKGHAMRARILDAAAEVFAQNGYERTRVADIVHLAGTAHGNFYRHFADKDDVLAEVLRPLITEVRVAAHRKASATVVPTLDDLIERSTAHFRAYARTYRLLRVMREAAARGESASFLDLWLAERQRFVARTERWLGDLRRLGHIETSVNLRLLAESLGALTEQVAYVYIGLVPSAVDDSYIVELGRTCGRIWFLSIFGDAQALDASRRVPSATPAEAANA
jgi:AcrR family transcriptional regulator